VVRRAHKNALNDIASQRRLTQRFTGGFCALRRSRLTFSLRLNVVNRHRGEEERKNLTFSLRLNVVNRHRREGDLFKTGLS